jgi:hypothetical protein
MELRDFIVTPLLIIVVYLIAFLVRPHCTDALTRKYFFPALTVRIIGALAVGFIYQFYYHGGDTFAYHTHGSRHIWEAFMDSPVKGVRLLFSNGEYGPGLWDTAQKIWYWKDEHSFFVIRVATIFDLITFSSYSGTAVLFAVVSFIGAWLLFQAFYKVYPEMKRWLAISCLFIPTVVFWGSGIFKDTLTLASLGAATFSIYSIFIEKKFSTWKLLLLVFCFFVIYSIKVYILLCFLPAAIAWIFSSKLAMIRSMVFKLMITPVVIVLGFWLAFAAIKNVAEDDPRYNLDRIAETARITAYDIRYGWGARFGEGSGYTLGEIDGTLTGMIKLAPSATNVTLFRPYLWEVRNPLMLLSAIEAFAVLLLTCYTFFKTGANGLRLLTKPTVMFCILFALIFAFAVGLSTGNFGTLSRYKIPVMPFYVLGLGLILHYSKSERKVAALEMTEY